MLFKSLLFASAFAAFANAQTIVTSSASSIAPASTVAQSMPPAATQGFDISNITTATRFQWCLAQQNTCPQICGGAASLNQCDETTLQYSCVCPNGTVPDSSAYQQTVPFFICQANYGQCINRHPNDAEGQATCKQNQQCGTENATANALASTSAAAASTASSTSSRASGSATSASASATASNVASAASFTNGAFVVMLAAAFKLLL